MTVRCAGSMVKVVLSSICARAEPLTNKAAEAAIRIVFMVSPLDQATLANGNESEHSYVPLRVLLPRKRALSEARPSVLGFRDGNASGLTLVPARHSKANPGVPGQLTAIVLIAAVSLPWATDAGSSSTTPSSATARSLPRDVIVPVSEVTRYFPDVVKEAGNGPNNDRGQR